MAKRGRPPKPVALKILQGNPGKRPLTAQEPQVDLAQEAEPPEWMTDFGKELWRRLVPQLLKARLLTEVDYAGLQMACEAYSVWREMTEFLNEYGRIQTSQTGYEQARPEVSMQKQALDSYNKFMSEFGLSPSARSRLRVEPEAEQAEDEKRFFG